MKRRIPKLKWRKTLRKSKRVKIRRIIRWRIRKEINKKWKKKTNQKTRKKTSQMRNKKKTRKTKKLKVFIKNLEGLDLLNLKLMSQRKKKKRKMKKLKRMIPNASTILLPKMVWTKQNVNLKAFQSIRTKTTLVSWERPTWTTLQTGLNTMLNKKQRLT